MSDDYETNAVSPPCLILAHPDTAYEAEVARAFRRLGWDVYEARSGPEIRRLVPMLEADAVILDAELPNETGWLTCEKLTAEQPLVKVVLVTSEPGPRNLQLAAFVGASSLVSHGEGLAPLVEEICGRAVPAAN
jgi:DNA-binding response OmpR family regulator